MSERLIGGQYWLFSNGGISFRVVDKGFGPCLQIELDSFASMKSKVEVLTNRISLKKLADLLSMASMVTNYTEYYCHKTTYRHDEELTEEDAKLLEDGLKE